MSDRRTDEAVGRAKEAAGALTDNDDLKNEGRADRAASSVKEKVHDAKDKAEEAVDSVKRKVSGRD